MAEVLLVGVTHYPPLMGLDRDMSWVLQWTLQDPDIPETLKRTENWPSEMQSEYGDDAGEASAAGHRATLVDGFRKVRGAIDDFAPDVVVFWGDDQYENFREDVIPPFCVLAYDDIVATPWALPKWANKENIWSEPPEMTLEVKGAREFGLAFATQLLERDIDMSYAYEPLHYATLSHAFLNALLLLDYDRTGFPYPVLPVAVNCYGSRVVSHGGGLSRLADRERPLDPPGPTPRRCMTMGAAMAEIAAASPWKVAFVASSSWSHAFLTDHTYRLYPDIPADRALFESLVKGDYETWRSTTTADIEHAGQQEVLNWFCLAGAAEALGVVPDWSRLVETFVFNSNKVFATYPVVAAGSRA